MTFAEKLKAARKKAGLTQAQAAARLGVTQPRIARWEAGGRTPPEKCALTQAEILLRLAPRYATGPAPAERVQ